MNFKRNLLTISALIATVFAFAGCSNKKAFYPYEFINYVNKEETFLNAPAKRNKEYKNYYARGKADSQEVEAPLVNIGSFYDVMTKNAGKKLIPSEGEQKIIVVPVQFSDYEIQNNVADVSDYILNLKKAFFGSGKNNNYVSVSQFYNESSYGKLRLTGLVCEDVFTYKDSVTTLLLRNRNGSDIRREILGYYKDITDHVDNYLKKIGMSIDDFRIHKDENREYDIPIYLVYDYPADSTSNFNSFFWNYTFPENLVSWSSYTSLNIANNKPDAHTFIHEVGHLLGLVDYYPLISGNDDETVIEPVGCIDMMDCSIGDHTSLSKMFLDWVRPIHVTGNCHINISSFVESGDVILLNDNWNGTVFDEYYLLEFYTPTKLNTFDVVYGNNKAKLPSIPGVKIYHVDATLGYYTKDTEGSSRGDYKLRESCDIGGYDPNKTKIDFIRDNTTYKKQVGVQYTNNYLYELIYNHYNAAVPGAASDEHLFHSGDEKTSFSMNGNRSANYKIKITGLSFKEASILIEKIN